MRAIAFSSAGVGGRGIAPRPRLQSAFANPGTQPITQRQVRLTRADTPGIERVLIHAHFDHLVQLAFYAMILRYHFRAPPRGQGARPLARTVATICGHRSNLAPTGYMNINVDIISRQAF